MNNLYFICMSVWMEAHRQGQSQAHPSKPQQHNRALSRVLKHWWGVFGHLNLWHLADTHIQSDLHQSDFYITEELRVKRFAQGTSNDSLGTGI